jgi:GNAT superfamily N-acetyltransferase
MSIELVPARIQDASLIWEMQKESFQELLLKYQDYDTNPANEPLSKVESRIQQDHSYYYFIQENGQTVGAVRVVDPGDGSSKKISPIFILPEFQNKGLGKAAMNAVELIHGERGWELGTILQEERDCHFYERMGYKRSGKVTHINEKMTIVGYWKE